MSLRALLSRWQSDPSVATNIEAWHNLPPRPARYVPFPLELEPQLAMALEQSGIRQLYTHQAEAWQLVQSGKNLVIVTGTASGKTLAYNLPVLDRLLRNPQARALYIFPTKALAQDQANNLRSFLSQMSARTPETGGNSSQAVPIPIATYDGDTASRDRPAIRKAARLVITNPDMLHAGILPHHTAWSDFFRHLDYVVIDEMHAYRGVFGSHVANVMRRLKRVARFYGSNLQFVLTSATIGNPAELAERLVEERVALVDQDGAARGPKSFLIYNPPIVDKALGLRRSALQESVHLAEDLLSRDIQTIIFGRSRRTVEIVLTYLREKAPVPLATSKDLQPASGDASRSSSQQDTVRGYRSGYLPQKRREIERGLREGAVRAVVATNALELGIDIGGLGAALLIGYPGTIAGTWQQAGRAGRGEEASLAVMVATADPLDQFLARHPGYFFERSPEQAFINPDNLLILLDHIRCAAFELPFESGDTFGDLSSETLAEFLAFLFQEGVLHQSGPRYYWMADQYPAQNVSLRSASASNVVLQVGDEYRTVTLGEVDQASASWLVHPQAIYLHEAQSYFVDDLDLEAGIARLRPIQVDYYTDPQRETKVQLLESTGAEAVSGGTKANGEIRVITKVTGYRKVRWHTHEQIGLGKLDLPPSELETTGYWISLGPETVDCLREAGLWRNDPNDYGPNWESQRQHARQRDGYRCQVCGAAEDGRSHDVHHKIPFRAFTSYYEANQLDNLVTLCHPCHRMVETSVRVRSGLAGLAFVLGHLAPFYLMCDQGDLGVHSDPSSPLAEGGPAVVLYDQIPAGIGFSQRLYEIHEELVRQAYELVSGCACEDGCPSCVGPGGEGGSGGKRETLAILEVLIGEGKT